MTTTTEKPDATSTASAVEAIRAAGGKQLKGPSAMSGEVDRALHLTWTLAYLEFRLKFFGSVLGYIWQLGRPLAMFGVLYVVFVPILHQGEGIPYYAPMLLFGIMLYQFFGEATGGAVAAVLTRENLVRKIHFPRIVIPLSVVVAATLTLAVNAIAVGVFMAFQQVPIRLNWLVVIPVLGFLLVFITGLAMLLSSLFVRYRDVQPIWDVVLQATFYATPILYPLEMVPDKVEEVLLASPLAACVQQIRHSVFDPSAPSPLDVMGWQLIWIPIVLGIGTFLLGLYVFNKSAPAVAEEL